MLTTRRIPTDFKGSSEQQVKKIREIGPKISLKSRINKNLFSLMYTVGKLYHSLIRQKNLKRRLRGEGERGGERGGREREKGKS